MRRSYEFVEHSAAAPERVWELLADATGWSSWAGPLIMQSWWEKEGTPAPGGIGAIRGLGSRVGSRVIGSREEITAFDPPAAGTPGHMAYVILTGAPVTDYQATVDVLPDGTGSTVEWRGSYQPRPAWAGPVIHVCLTRVVAGLCRRLAGAATG